MKRIFRLLIVISLCTTFVVPVYAAPSPWATGEVASSVERQLVPDSLNDLHQNQIKRYEYVLLAMEILNQTGRDIELIRLYPFTDIYGHRYEQAIVKAYNAGIINGDGKGHFNPDAYITRQEVAVLVSNLVTVLNGDIPADQGNVYADSSSIAQWAKPSVDYCYDHSIVKGVGNDGNGLPMMDPQGSATREQAIVLLYRLAKNQRLLKDIDLGENGYTDFAHNSNEAVARHLLYLNAKKTVNVSAITKENFILNDAANNQLTLFQTSSMVSINVSTSTPISDEFSDITLELCEFYCDPEQIEIILNRSKNGFNEDPNYSFQNISSDGTSITVSYDEVNQLYRYKISIDNRIKGGQR